MIMRDFMVTFTQDVPRALIKHVLNYLFAHHLLFLKMFFDIYVSSLILSK